MVVRIPGKTFKNKKMAGHLGSDRITTLNLKVVKTDVERGLILVEGAVPGVAGGYIYGPRRGEEERPPRICRCPASSAPAPRRRLRPKPRPDQQPEA